MRSYECSWCGVEFTPKYRHRKTCCSTACGFEHQRWLARLRRVERHGNKRRICHCCFRVFMGTPSRRLCSDDCRKVQARMVSREGYVPVKDRAPFVTKECAHCGQEFSTNYNASRRRFCSERCSIRNSKRTRRHRRRGGFIEEVTLGYVLKRDAHRCQICRRKVNAKREPPHPQAPVLDHIVPLARGGTTERANIQLAHSICNSRKSDRAVGSQLLLIG